MRMSDRSFVVVSGVGTDRPGIVEDLSGWVLEAGGNIEESRMALLGGEFAALILVSGPAGLEKKLEDSRDAFAARKQLTLFTKSVSPSPPTPSLPLIRYSLRAVTLDHAGIVHQVAQLLRQQSVNIVSATTRIHPAPFTGAPVFQFHMEIDIPSSVPVPALRESLDKLGYRENIDFTLSAAGE